MTTKTGPQKYPGASTSHWYQGTYPGDPMNVNVCVLHTTEGRTLPDYDGGAIAPNLTAVPDLSAKRLVWYQHYDIDVSSRALVNLRGGVETNTLNVVQVELTGTCDPATHKKWGTAGHIYWPQAPEWALRDLARFLAWLHTEHGVPLSGPAAWPAYPASYGTSNGARMSASAWESFRGVCGHLHVTENEHGDPGAIDFPTLIGYAKEIAGAPAAPTGGGKTGTALPKVSLAKLVKAAKTDPGAAQGHQTYAGGVRLVEKALLELGYLASPYAGDGSYGSKTVAAYARWQHWYSDHNALHWSAADCDGIPGKASLAALGKQTALFTVVA